MSGRSTLAQNPIRVIRVGKLWSALWLGTLSLVVTSASSAEVVNFPVRNRLQDLTATPIGGGYSDVRLQSSVQDERMELQGAPALPVLLKVVLLPPDGVVREVSVVRQSVLEVPGETRPFPIGEGRRDQREENPEYYDRAGAYPDQEAFGISVEDNGGFRLLRIAVMPVSFHPSANAITLTSELEVVVEYDRRPQDRIAMRRTDALFAADPALRNWVAEAVVNADEIDRWYPRPSLTQPPSAEDPREMGLASRFLQTTPSEWPSVDSPPVEVVIVTSSEMLQGQAEGDPVAEMNRYAAWRDSSLQSETEVRLVEHIREQYPAEDAA